MLRGSSFFKQKFSTSKEIEVEGVVIPQEKEKSKFYDGIIDNEPYIYHKNKREVNISFQFAIKLTHQEIIDSGYSNYDDLVTDYLSTTHDYATINFAGKIKSLDKKSLSEIILDEVKLNSHEIFTSTKPKEYFNSSDKLKGNSIAFQNLIGIFNDAILFIDNDRYFTKEQQNKSNLKLTATTYKNWMSNYSLDPYKYKKFQDLLQFIRDSKIGKLKMLSNLDLSFAISKGNEIEIMLSNGSERLPIDSFGTGINQILYLLTQLFFTDSKIILIEELELNLSPKTQREFFKILRKLISEKIIDQVYFTTHSKAFNFRNDFSVFEVDISNNGESNIKYLSTGLRKGFFVSSLID